jgi:N-acetylglucosamine transport system permease protein
MKRERDAFHISPLAVARRGAWLRKVTVDFALYTPLVLWTLFIVFCFFWLILTSFKTNRELFANVWALPSSLQLQNYIKAWSVVKMGRQFLNSVIIVFISLAALLAMCAPAAYVLSRFKFPGVESLTNAFIAGMGIPFPLLFVPLFVLMAGLRLVGTIQGLIVIYVSLSIPFTVYLLTGFFRSLPEELEEAGRIDGCSEFGIFWRVMLPLASPGLITAAIFNFVGLWNEYMLALVFTNDTEKMPLSRGLYAMANSMQYTGDWVGLFAGTVIVMIPATILYIVLSDRMIEGITLGAVK